MSSSPPTLLKTETDSRDSHGGQARIKAARFPARKTLEEFDFAFQASIPKNTVLIERHRRVDQRLALLHRRARHRHVHDVGAEPLSGQLERRLRAGRGFVEEVDLGAAAQRRGFLLRLPRDRDRPIRPVEQKLDVGGGKIADAQKMAVGIERQGRSVGHLKALL